MIFAATLALVRREILRFVRQRSRWIGALATPLLFWLLIGGGLRGSFRNPQGGSSYFEFFFPGAIALSVLFTAIFSTISVIEDRHQGFLQGVLVSPTPRSALVASKLGGGALLSLLQGGILLCLAPFVGLHLGLLQVLLALFFIALMGLALTALGFLFAWKIDSVQGYHSLMNMVLMPMWLLSGAVFPIASSHPIFRAIAIVNPMTYAVEALREAMAPGLHAPNLMLSTIVLVAFTAVIGALSVVLVRKPETSKK